MTGSFIKCFLMVITATFVAVNCSYAQGINITPSFGIIASGKTDFLSDEGQEDLKIRSKNDISVTAKARGGVDSGGGTLIKFANRLGLLDLYVHNQSDFYDSSAPVLLEETRSYQKFGIDVLDSESKIFQKTLEKITAWEKTSPLLATNLKKAFLNLPIFYLSGTFEFIDGSYELPPEFNLPKTDLQLGAFYIKNFGVIISKNDFERLSEKNQIALLIHETLRHQQISFGQQSLSTNLLQKLTAALMKEPNKSLDIEPFLTGSQLWFYLRRPKVLNELQLLSRSICPRISNTCIFGHLKEDVDLDLLSKSLSKALSEVGSIANNSYDMNVISEYHAAHSALLNVYGKLIDMKMALKDQDYSEVIFDLSSMNIFIGYLGSYNLHKDTDSTYANKFLLVLRQFHESGLIRTP